VRRHDEGDECGGRPFSDPGEKATTQFAGEHRMWTDGERVEVEGGRIYAETLSGGDP